MLVEHREKDTKFCKQNQLGKGVEDDYVQLGWKQ